MNIPYFKLCLTFILLLFLHDECSSQAKIGDKIPLEEAELISIQNASPDSSKMIVLDFWATWCGPCIAALPHLESLQKTFSEKIQFLAISDEPRNKVMAFLSKHPYDLDFMIDSKKFLFQALQVESLPQTVLLSNDRTLLWVGNSYDLPEILTKTDSLVTSALIRNAASSDEKRTPATLPSNSEGGPAYYNYSITKASSSDQFRAMVPKGSLMDSAINIYYSAVPVSVIIQDLLGIPDIQFTNHRTDLDTLLINLIVKSSNNALSYARERKNILADIQKLFHFKINIHRKKHNGYVLKIIDPSKLSRHQEPTEGGGVVQSQGNTYQITRLSLSEFSGFLQQKMDKMIIYRSNDKNKYNFTLSKPLAVKTLNAELGMKFGLQLSPFSKDLTLFEIR